MFFLIISITACVLGHTISPAPDSRVLTAHYDDAVTNRHVHRYANDGITSYWNIGDNDKIAGIWEFGDTDDSYAQFPELIQESQPSETAQNAPQGDPVGDSVSEPTTASEPDTAGDTASNDGIQSDVCSDTLSIVSVEKLRQPSRVYITLRNTGRHYANLDGWYLQLLNADGEVKYAKLLDAIPITYQKSRGETHADTTIVLIPYRKTFEVYQARYKILFPYNAKRVKGYKDGDIFALACDGNEITRYPEAVMASPQLQRQLTTTWASLKGR